MRSLLSCSVDVALAAAFCRAMNRDSKTVYSTVSLKNKVMVSFVRSISQETRDGGVVSGTRV